VCQSIITECEWQLPEQNVFFILNFVFGRGVTTPRRQFSRASCRHPRFKGFRPATLGREVASIFRFGAIRLSQFGEARISSHLIALYRIVDI